MWNNFESRGAHSLEETSRGLTFEYALRGFENGFLLLERFRKVHCVQFELM
jgi:hypothetical protein